MNPKKASYQHYNKTLQPLANKLRHEMTKAESCLWKYVLKSRKMKGLQFRRQRPVLNYIADFMCQELKLIIEVDGITHHTEEAVRKDEHRTKVLEGHGYTVIRFRDEEVLHNIESVARQIEVVVEQLTHPRHFVPPPPAGDNILQEL
jgi:very-short-patch-repair endonuclease